MATSVSDIAKDMEEIVEGSPEASKAFKVADGPEGESIIPPLGAYAFQFVEESLEFLDFLLGTNSFRKRLDADDSSRE